MERKDIAIIGSGPAGISAALTAKARNKDVYLFGSGRTSEKVSKAHLVRNYPGLPDITGEDFEEAFLNHLKVMDIPMINKQVTNIYAMPDYFAIQTPDEMYEAKALILATGVVQGKPLPNENELLGKGVSYCATCDAFLYKDKTVAVLGYNDESKEEAEFLASTCKDVYYYPMKDKQSFDQDNIHVMPQRATGIVGEQKVAGVQSKDGVQEVDGVFILRDAISPAVLVPGLELDGNHVKVNLQMETNLPGCFACGDVAGTPYQYVKAAGQGNVAALSAVTYLQSKK